MNQEALLSQAKEFLSYEYDSLTRDEFEGILSTMEDLSNRVLTLSKLVNRGSRCKL